MFCLNLQSGRKPLLLLGSIVVGVLMVAVGALIQFFDLEREGEALSSTQKVAGYFVMILVCLLMSVFVLSLKLVLKYLIQEFCPCIIMFYSVKTCWLVIYFTSQNNIIIFVYFQNR